MRLEKGLEQRELARKIGVGEASVYNSENDRKRLSPKSMHRLAQFFKISRRILEELEMESKKDF